MILIISYHHHLFALLFLKIQLFCVRVAASFTLSV